MKLILYTVSGAPRGWRVLVGLAIKGLNPDVVYLSNSNGELKSPNFLKINPRATIPVLETDGGVLRDSIGILAWLDREYPENPLFGKTAKEAGEIWQLTLECCDYLRQANNELLSKVFSSNGSIPAKNSSEFGALTTSANLLHAELNFLNELLSDGRQYLCGNMPSAADAIAYPEVRLVQRAVETKFELMEAMGFCKPEESSSKLAAWLGRLNSDPAIKNTKPIHWN